MLICYSTYDNLYIIISYKELAYKMIMEAEKSQDLQAKSVSWRPRGANGIVRSESKSLRTRRTNGVNPSSKSVVSEIREKTMFSLRAVRQEEFPLTQGILRFFVLFKPSNDWIRLTHIREGNLLYSVY